MKFTRDEFVAKLSIRNIWNILVWLA